MNLELYTDILTLLIEASLNQACQAGNDESCATTNAGCSSTSPFVCVCRPGYVQSGTVCISDTGMFTSVCLPVCLSVESSVY